MTGFIYASSDFSFGIFDRGISPAAAWYSLVEVDWIVFRPSGGKDPQSMAHDGKRISYIPLIHLAQIIDRCYQASHKNTGHLTGVLYDAASRRQQPCYALL
jgi:hypothetical protein